MVTGGNIYCDGTGTGTDQVTNLCSPNNSMTIGTIENCLTTAPPGTNTQHSHIVHLIIQNVEDLIAWQVRLNYIGDRMRIMTYNATPFTDSLTFDPVGFTNLPVDVDAHRGVLLSSDIPPAPPNGSNTPQTARIGAVYNGALTLAVSPDTPQKAVHDESTQTYSTTGGGILATLTLQVLPGNAGQPSLFMNLDDDNPNTPGSSALVFTGSGTMEINLASGVLGDGYHGEGATCIPLNCTTHECPLVDNDGDGWSDAAETVIGTDPYDACADSVVDDAWPADINNDTFIDTADIGAVTNHFGKAVPPAPARVNTAPDPPDGFVDTGDIGRITGLFDRRCPGF
jgi:hypothetical protein